MATCNIVNMIAAGQIDVGISGGAETFSDFPIRYNRTVGAAWWSFSFDPSPDCATAHLQVRESIINLQKAKMIDKVKLHANIAYNLYRFEMPGVLEYTTGESMGSSGDRLAAAFGVTRE
jgi:acetyl-CoA acyltransferase